MATGALNYVTFCMFNFFLLSSCARAQAATWQSGWTWSDSPRDNRIYLLSVTRNNRVKKSCEDIHLCKFSIVYSL